MDRGELGDRPPRPLLRSPVREMGISLASSVVRPASPSLWADNTRVLYAGRIKQDVILRGGHRALRAYVPCGVSPSLRPHCTEYDSVLTVLADHRQRAAGSGRGGRGAEEGGARRALFPCFPLRLLSSPPSARQCVLSLLLQHESNLVTHTRRISSTLSWRGWVGHAMASCPERQLSTGEEGTHYPNQARHRTLQCQSLQ